MKAISYDLFGPIDVLHLADLPEPVAGKSQVVVKINATSVNVIDSRVRNGQMGLLVDKKFPKIPGADVAGIVSAVGPGVTDLKVGDAVFGAADPFKGGAFADAISLPASQLALKPPQLSFEDAAALPIAGLAALLSIRDLGQLKAGQEVLIHGASGAVGLFATQIAKQLGAKVTAIAGTGGIAALKAFGADTIVDYKSKDAGTIDRTFDVVINASGKLPFAKARRHLKPNGRMIEPSPTIPVFIGSKISNLLRGQQHLMLQTFPRRADLDTLADMFAEGSLETTIAEVYPLAAAVAAFRQHEKGGTVGKIVVTV